MDNNIVLLEAAVMTTFSNPIVSFSVELVISQHSIHVCLLLVRRGDPAPMTSNSNLRSVSSNA